MEYFGLTATDTNFLDICWTVIFAFLALTPGCCSVRVIVTIEGFASEGTFKVKDNDLVSPILVDPLNVSTAIVPSPLVLFGI